MGDEAYLNVISMRKVRIYADRPIADEEARLILEAGRAAGSSQNRQPWRFYATRDRALLDRISETVFEPDNLLRCRLAVAIASAKGGFDIGRCAENMMLAAWAYNIGSAPNGVRQPEPLAEMLGLPEGESVATVVSFGHRLKRAARPEGIGEVLDGLKRKRLDELVVWV